MTLLLGRQIGLIKEIGVISLDILLERKAREFFSR